MWRHAGERRDRNVVGAVAAAVVVILFPGTLSVAVPGAAAPAVSAPDETTRPFEVGARERREAGKEVARGAKKIRNGDARAALKHYLAALQFDPYNVAAREGLAALVGP